MVYCYIDGQRVSSKQARNYLTEALKRHETAGYDISVDITSAWQNKAKSEQAREDIHDITAILEHGGLEIVTED